MMALPGLEKIVLYIEGIDFSLLESCSERQWIRVLSDEVDILPLRHSDIYTPSSEACIQHLEGTKLFAHFTEVLRFRHQ
jgi:hypothetical protein